MFHYILHSMEHILNYNNNLVVIITYRHKASKQHYYYISTLFVLYTNTHMHMNKHTSYHTISTSKILNWQILRIMSHHMRLDVNRYGRLSQRIAFFNHQQEHMHR